MKFENRLILRLFICLLICSCVPGGNEEVEDSLEDSFATNPPEDETVAPNCFIDRHQLAGEFISRKLDILIVPDTSGSIRQERSDIALGFRSFVNSIPSQVDYNIGVLLAHSPRSNQSGVLFKQSNEPVVLKSSEMTISEIERDLNRKLERPRTEGRTDGGEVGMLALLEGLKSENLTTMRSQGLFRQDAAVLIVFIADEQDICAEFPEGVTPVVDPQNGERKTFVEYCIEENINYRDVEIGSSIYTYKITPQIVYNRVSEVVGINPLVVGGVLYDERSTIPTGNEDEIGYGYLDVLRLAGGFNVDLSNGDFSQGLATLGRLATAKMFPESSFALRTEKLDPTTLTVKVDGSSFPFVYDPALNTVTLSEDRDALSVAEVSYCSDDIAPNINLISTFDDVIFTPDIDLVANVEDVNDVSTEIFINGNLVETIDGNSINVPLTLNEGLNTIGLVSIDSVGNSSEQITISINVNLDPPSLAILPANGFISVNNDRPSLTFSYDGFNIDLSSLSVKVNSQDVSNLLEVGTNNAVLLATPPLNLGDNLVEATLSNSFGRTTTINSNIVFEQDLAAPLPDPDDPPVLTPIVVNVPAGIPSTTGIHDTNDPRFGVNIDVPQGATREDISLSLTIDNEFEIPQFIDEDKAFVFNISDTFLLSASNSFLPGLTFGEPVLVTIPFDSSYFLQGVFQEDQFSIARYSDEDNFLEIIKPFLVDKTNGLVHFATSNFSWFTYVNNADFLSASIREPNRCINFEYSREFCEVESLDYVIEGEIRISSLQSLTAPPTSEFNVNCTGIYRECPGFTNTVVEFDRTIPPREAGLRAIHYYKFRIEGLLPSMIADFSFAIERNQERVTFNPSLNVVPPIQPVEPPIAEFDPVSPSCNARGAICPVVGNGQVGYAPEGSTAEDSPSNVNIPGFNNLAIGTDNLGRLIWVEPTPNYTPVSGEEFELAIRRLEDDGTISDVLIFNLAIEEGLLSSIVDENTLSDLDINLTGHDNTIFLSLQSGRGTYRLTRSAQLTNPRPVFGLSLDNPILLKVTDSDITEISPQRINSFSFITKIAYAGNDEMFFLGGRFLSSSRNSEVGIFKLNINTNELNYLNCNPVPFGLSANNTKRCTFQFEQGTQDASTYPASEVRDIALYDGELYFTVPYTRCIRKINKDTNQVETVGGICQPMIDEPNSVSRDDAVDRYLEDLSNNAAPPGIDQDPNGAFIIGLIYGNSFMHTVRRALHPDVPLVADQMDPNGDEIDATSAYLGQLGNLEIDSEGNIYFSEQLPELRYRVIRKNDGKIQTISGGGSTPLTISNTPILGTQAMLPVVTFIESRYDAFTVDLFGDFYGFGGNYIYRQKAPIFGLASIDENFVSDPSPNPTTSLSVIDVSIDNDNILSILESSQRQDGFWDFNQDYLGENLSENERSRAFLDTIDSLNLYRSLNIFDGPQIDKALNWVANQNFTSTSNISKQLDTIAKFFQDRDRLGSVHLAQVRLIQNLKNNFRPELFGWGSDQFSVTNDLDTAEALFGLSSAARRGPLGNDAPRMTDYISTVSRILNRQRNNPADTSRHGSWGINGTSSSPSVFATTRIIEGLLEYRLLPDFSSAIIQPEFRSSFIALRDVDIPRALRVAASFMNNNIRENDSFGSVEETAEVIKVLNRLLGSGIITDPTLLAATQNTVNKAVGFINDQDLEHLDLASLSKVIESGSTIASFVALREPAADIILSAQASGNGDPTSNEGTGADNILKATGTFNINENSSSGRTSPDGVVRVLSSLVSQNVLVVDNAKIGDFSAGDEVLIINLQGSNQVGTFEFARIQNSSGATLTLENPLTNSFFPDTDKVVVQRVPNYRSILPESELKITASPWNGSTGGVVALRVEDTVNANVTVDATGLGFRGGLSGVESGSFLSQQGEGQTGLLGFFDTTQGSNGCGGSNGSLTNSGGGGSHGSLGANQVGSSLSGMPGTLVGSNTLDQIFLGCGGGAGSSSDVDSSPTRGGAGGGIIMIFAKNFELNTNKVVANGESAFDGDNGTVVEVGSGGGSGGSILLSIENLTTSPLPISATGGNGSSGSTSNLGQNGGEGRIRINYDSINGSPYPSPGSGAGGVNISLPAAFGSNLN